VLLHKIHRVVFASNTFTLEAVKLTEAYCRLTPNSSNKQLVIKDLQEQNVTAVLILVQPQLIQQGS